MREILNKVVVLSSFITLNATLLIFYLEVCWTLLAYAVSVVSVARYGWTCLQSK